MKPVAPFVAETLLISCLAAVWNPALAICTSRAITASTYSSFVTSGCEAADCGTDGVGVTDNLVGVFWGLGDGDPAMGRGIDNGTVSALGNWLHTYPGYNAYLNGNWCPLGSPGFIDGVIDASWHPQRCMAILLADQHPDSGDGVFVLLTQSPNEYSDYHFETEGNLTLSTLGRLNAVSAAVDEFSGTVEVAIEGIDLSDIGAALYLDPSCGGVAEVVLGYEAFVTVLPKTAMPPDSSDVDLWQLATEVIPLGEGTSVRVNCAVDESVWLRAGLVFDSEFRTPYLSAQSRRLACKPSPRKPRSRQLPGRRPKGHPN